MNTIELPLWEILVPHKMGKHDNTDPSLHRSNKVIHVSYHKAWDEYVRSIAGGLTVYKASMGQWIDKESQDQKIYKEIMIPVRIACSREQIDQIAKYSLHHYAQKAIFVTLISESTIIYSQS